SVDTRPRQTDRGAYRRIAGLWEQLVCLARVWVWARVFQQCHVCFGSSGEYAGRRQNHSTFIINFTMMKSHLIYFYQISMIMLLSLGTIQAHAQTGEPITAIKQLIPVIDSNYRAFAIEQHSPGLAYAVVYNGKIIHLGNLGYTDVEQQIPVSEKSVFRIAS